MIWPTTFFFSRTFCPTFGINWTERIYSLTNLLLLWFICIRFIFCLKKVLLDYSIQVLDQEPRKIYREYTELTKSCLNRKIAGRLGHPWFSSTPTGGSQEGSTQNEDWEWDLIETCSLVFALAPVPKVKVKVTLWSWLCPWGPGDSVIRIDSFQTVNVENLDVNFLLSPKFLFRGILIGFVIFFLWRNKIILDVAVVTVYRQFNFSFSPTALKTLENKNGEYVAATLPSNKSIEIWSFGFWGEGESGVPGKKTSTSKNQQQAITYGVDSF